MNCWEYDGLMDELVSMTIIYWFDCVLICNSKGVSVLNVGEYDRVSLSECVSVFCGVGYSASYLISLRTGGGQLSGTTSIRKWKEEMVVWLLLGAG